MGRLGVALGGGTGHGERLDGGQAKQGSKEVIVFLAPAKMR